jgi:hypothetical protein
MYNRCWPESKTEILASVLFLKFLYRSRTCRGSASAPAA